MDIAQLVYYNLQQIISDDKKNILYLLYYSLIEGILFMVSPLTSAFIINSVLAHATISITVLSLIVIIVFLMIALIQVLKEYMIEKFEQKIFVKNAIKTSELALLNKKRRDTSMGTDKYMNYFFDVLSIQKLFPILLLSGSGLVIKIVVSLFLLLIFDMNFFIMGVLFIFFFLFIVLFIGRKGAVLAVERSNAKHDTIHFIQNISDQEGSDEMKLKKLDELLIHFIQARRNIFSVIVKQLSLSYFIEGLILSAFFILGGYLVFEGKMPIGEFVAIEIIIISVLNALRDFMKQIDYIYDTIEGFYKIEKLAHSLKESHIDV
ncbi:MAG: ABC transporter ATP-binding protein [Sulfurimonas sp.]|nr:ABC transporter ATP-binding protein [Sulfurimonas sp.]